jgi:hypothetical protein
MIMKLLNQFLMPVDSQTRLEATSVVIFLLLALLGIILDRRKCFSI